MKEIVNRLIREVLEHQTDESALYAIVDAARDPEVYPSTLEPGLDVRCLYAGVLPEPIAHTAPYLVELDPETVFADTIREHWADSWGIVVRADADIETLRKHFRKLNYVRGPDGKRLLFRYYDPRVIRVYLPTCTKDELRQVFGPVKELVAVAEDGGSIRFAFDGEKLSVKHEGRVAEGETHG